MRLRCALCILYASAMTTKCICSGLSFDQNASKNNNNNNNRINSNSSYQIRRRLKKFLINAGPTSLHSFGAWGANDVGSAAQQVIEDEFNMIDWPSRGFGTNTEFRSIEIDSVEYTLWDAGTTDMIFTGGSVSFNSNSLDNVPTAEEINVIIYNILNTATGKKSLLNELNRQTGNKFSYITETSFNSLVFDITMFPTTMPTIFPTEVPTKSPTSSPTAVPTSKPTSSPTAVPTSRPTASPTVSPSRKPTSIPTSKPTRKPTKKPTDKPTSYTTEEPTMNPTEKPTEEPSIEHYPTTTPGVPTAVETTFVPTAVPPYVVSSSEPSLLTLEPTVVPSDVPVDISTSSPSSSTKRPPFATSAPSLSPSESLQNNTNNTIVGIDDNPHADGNTSTPILPVAAITGSMTFLLIFIVIVLGKRRHQKGVHWRNNIDRTYNREDPDGLHVQDSLYTQGSQHNSDVVDGIIGRLLSATVTVGYPTGGDELPAKPIGESRTMSDDESSTDDELSSNFPDNDTIEPNIVTLEANNESGTIMNSTAKEISDTGRNVVRVAGEYNKHCHNPELPYWENPPAFAPEIFHCALTPVDVSTVALSGNGGFDSWSDVDVSSEPPSDCDNSIIDTSDFATDWNPDDNSEDSSCENGNADPFQPIPIANDKKCLLKKSEVTSTSSSSSCNGQNFNCTTHQNTNQQRYDMEALAPPTSHVHPPEQGAPAFTSPSPLYEIL